MLRRSIFELSSLRSLKRIPRQISSQRLEPRRLPSRKEFSTASPKGVNGEPQQSKSSFPKVVLGGAIVAGAAYLAYESGYVDHFMGKEQQGYIDRKVNNELKEREQLAPTNSEETSKLSHDEEQVEQKIEPETGIPHAEAEQKVETSKDFPNDEKLENVSDIDNEKTAETQPDVPHHKVLDENQSKNLFDMQETSNGTTDGAKISTPEKNEQETSQSTIAEGKLGAEIVESKTIPESNEEVQVPNVTSQVKVLPDEGTTKSVQPDHDITEDTSEAAPGKAEVEAANLLDAYYLKEKAKESTVADGSVDQALVSAIEELNHGYIAKEGNMILNFLEAIHEAEKRQSELDARTFAEEKRVLKEKYEKELRELRARELMHAEEAAMLDKEIKRERAKAAAAIRALEEKMLEKLKMELEQKEKEAEMKVEKSMELAKAEVAAKIAREKASQIEKMAEANLHIDALCMAFYARSEEARQIHSVHKLALGALALEDALSKGLPIQQELDALNTYLEGIEKDSLLHLVLSSLPEETRHHGTDTLLQLNQKFNGLKGTLRHHVLIPPGGGGLMAHTLAQIASWLRFKEVDPSGNGIESIISRVENFLAQGNLAEAAETLQEGVKGSQAEEIAGDWARRARNRAITEQALMVLQSYATCISLTQ